MPADNSRPFSRIVGYARVSTKMQGVSGLGLEAQRAAIEGYARQHGATVLRIVDEVESGSRSDRPMLAEAMRLCRVTGAALVAAKVDRFGRKAKDLMELRDAPFPVIAVDTPNADGFMFGILALVAQKERESISARTKAALAMAKARGTKLGGDRGKRGDLLPHAKIGAAASVAVRQRRADVRTADLAPYIRELRAAGVVKLADIAAELTKLEIPTPRGGDWTASHVWRLLARIDGERG